LIEEFVPHVSSQEMYICIQSVRNGTLVYYCREGGVDIGDVDAKAEKLQVFIDDGLTEQMVLVSVSFFVVVSLLHFLSTSF
jgi:ATP citrate (pro-S)-lyase